MRMLRRIILVVTTILAVAPATAQRYDPRYPVCFQKWGEGGFTAIDCSYTSLDQCRVTASGRSAIATPTHIGHEHIRHRRAASIGDNAASTGTRMLRNSPSDWPMRAVAWRSATRPAAALWLFRTTHRSRPRQHGGGAVADCLQAGIKTD